MLSQLFAGDPLLDAIALDQERISRQRHRTSPAVRRVQAALLLWDPACLPASGADGDYGNETAAAVARFKHEELGVPVAEVIDDVGPRTVIRLDEIAALSEAHGSLGMLMVAVPSATDDDLVAARTAVERSGGEILLGLGRLASAVGGGPATREALDAMVGTLLAGVVTPDSPVIPDGLDTETAESVAAWISMLDPAYLLAQLDPHRLDGPRPSLGGCLREL